MYSKFQAGSPPPHFKRAHKKSRSGCVMCKQRRVKVCPSPIHVRLHADHWLTKNECDEARPNCERCRTRGLDCMYQDWLSKAQLPIPKGEGSSANSNETSADSPSATAAEKADSDIDLDTDDAIVSELELQQHYVEHTCRTLAAASTEETQQHSRCVAVPALAKTSTAVRSGMLALAACCMYTHASRDAGEDKGALLRTAYVHYNTCLSESGHQLQKLDEAEHVDAIVATTRILFVLGLAFCQIERRLGKSLADPECWAWLLLLRGNFAVSKAIGCSDEAFTSTRSQDMSSEVWSPESWKPSDNHSEASLARKTALDFLRRIRLPALSSLRGSLTESRRSFSAAEQTCYSKVVELLHEVLSHTCIAPRIQNFLRVVFVWPCRISSDFTECLTGGERLALIIYAHWLMLTVLLEDLWIVGDMGRAGIFEIVARSGEWSEMEQELLFWPKRMLSLSR